MNQQNPNNYLNDKYLFKNISVTNGHIGWFYGKK